MALDIPLSGSSWLDIRQPRQLHSDAKYGHQPGEINFWMPLTSQKATRSRRGAVMVVGKSPRKPNELILTIDIFGPQTIFNL